MTTVGKGTGYLAIGGAGLLLAVGYLAMAFRLPFGEMERPGAAVFPVIAGAIFAFASFSALWEGWRMDRTERVEVPSGGNLARLASLLGALVGYFALLPWLGQLIGAFLFCVALMRTLSSVSWTRIVIYAAVMSMSVYVVFIHLLKVPMPRGILAP